VRRGPALGDTARRLGVASVLLGLVVALLVARLVQVQGVQARSYAAVAQSERLRTVDVPATRGAILDRDGEVLARSVPARTITADPMLIADPVGYAQLLAPQLGVEADTLAKKMSDRPRRYVVLARNIDPEVWRTASQTIDPRTGKKIRGVFAETTSKRVYPADAVAANVLGFVNAAGVGMGGVERAFDQLLAGTPGKQTYERDRRGGRIATAGSRTVEPIAGQDLQLTIDREIQWYAQQAIAAKVNETKAASGTVVIQDIATGELLAMATAPTFDPNHPGRGSDENRGNRAVSQVYEPGSIAKVVSTAAVLDQHAGTPTTKLRVPNRLHRAGKTLKDHWDHGTIKLTLTGALAKSSNIGIVQAVDEISLTSLYRYMKGFGLGEPTGLGFPGESRGILADVEDWNASQKYTVTFGQGFALNTVQAASIYQTIGNGGVRVEPRLVKSWTDQTGRLHVPTPPETRRVIAAETAKTLTAMMEQVVAPGGAAPQLRMKDYRVAGKTGTAQYANPACGCYRGYTASFAGFAPADAPRVAISVTLQLPRKGYSGGALAGPVFVKVMQFTLQNLGVLPTGTKAARIPLTW
jgi:cell division protein FtsI (penicillin-binding protein 3)